MSLKLEKKIIEILWSINLLIASLIIGVSFVLYFIFTYD